MKPRYFEKVFAAEYLKHGENGTQAYLAIRPYVKARSASVQACRLLKKIPVLEAIQEEIDNWNRR